MVTERLGNMNVTAGLVLTTSAVFISTAPPFQPLMPYASHGNLPDPSSNFVELTNAQAALLSLMTGTSVLIIYDTCYGNADMKHILKSLKRSRFRLVCSLIMMAYPSLALAVSTLALLTGLRTRPDVKSAISKVFSAVFIAGFTSDKLFVRILTGITYLTLAVLGVLAVIVFGTAWSEADPTDNRSQPSSEPKGDGVVSHRESKHSDKSLPKQTV
ncbi:hypothetical protein BDR04DRAFT_1233905 [Suillus decipiens]|nr:hypothetical protein BDR04DRAFT_1233905 [Suillus decipiens]